MHDRLREVWASFTSALAALDLHSSFEAEEPGTTKWDAVGSIEGVPVIVELKAAPGVGDVLQLERMTDSEGAYPVLRGSPCLYCGERRLDGA